MPYRLVAARAPEQWLETLPARRADSEQAKAASGTMGPPAKAASVVMRVGKHGPTPEKTECLCPALFDISDQIGPVQDPGRVVHPDEESPVTLGNRGIDRLR